LRIIAKLVARKQRLLERLKEDLGPRERAEIERQLEEIDATFDFLDGPLPKSVGCATSAFPPKGTV